MMKNLTTVIFLVVLCCLNTITFFSSAQSYNVQLEPQRQAFKIGEQINLKITYTLPSTAKFALPQFSDTITNSIEVIEITRMDTTYPKEDVSIAIIDQELIITSFDTGFQIIPPIKVFWENDSVVSNPMLLEVVSEQIDESAEIKDIKDPLEVSFSLFEWLSDYWHWLAIFLALILLVVIYFVYFHNRNKEEYDDKLTEKVLLPHEVALNALKGLETKQLWQKDMVKAYHSEISEILRTYLEARYRINALEQTTAEIFENLRLTDISSDQKAILNRILRLSDMVKFAKEKPSALTNEKSMEESFSFVNVTKELEEEMSIDNDTNKTTDEQ